MAPACHDGQVLITGHIRRDWIIRNITNQSAEIHQVQGVPLHHILTRVILRCDSARKLDHLNFVVVAQDTRASRFLRRLGRVQSSKSTKPRRPQRQDRTGSGSPKLA